MNVPEGFARAWTDLLMHVAASAASMADDHTAATVQRDSCELWRRIEDHCRSVQGNRGAATIISFANARRMTAGALRIVLAYLEEHDGPPV